MTWAVDAAQILTGIAGIGAVLVADEITRLHILVAAVLAASVAVSLLVVARTEADAERDRAHLDTLLRAMELPFFIIEAVSKVVDAVADVAQRGGLNGQDDPQAIYAALQRHWDIDDIGGLKVRDVQLQRADSGGLSLGYSYDARAHLFYNVYIVLHFAADVPMRRSSGDR